MSHQTIHRKLKKLEKMFSAGQHDPTIIVEMWQPCQDDPQRYGEEVERAAQQLRQGQKLVVVPHGGGKALRKIGNKLKKP